MALVREDSKINEVAFNKLVSQKFWQTEKGITKQSSSSFSVYGLVFDSSGLRVWGSKGGPGCVHRGSLATIVVILGVPCYKL